MHLGGTMEINHYVTKWGFPGLRWWDTISNMTGNPLTDNMPAIKSHQVERRMWINADGAQVVALDKGKPAVAGDWYEWDNLVLATTRLDLSPNDQILLQKNRFAWVEHQIIEAHFSDGTVNRIAQSAVPEIEMRRLHETIAQTFITGRPRARFEPPDDGLYLPGENIIEATIQRRARGEENKTRANVPWQDMRIDRGGGEFYATNFWKEDNVPSVEWQEPVTARKWWGGKRHHLLRRMLYVDRGVRPHMNTLQFATYRPDGKTINASGDLALLKGFRVVPSSTIKWPKEWLPVRGLRDGFTIIADFRYGYFMPLTNCPGEIEIEVIKNLIERTFMPIVGKFFTDQELGLAPSQKPNTKPRWRTK
jgi:hypothetical protein